MRVVAAEKKTAHEEETSLAWFNVWLEMITITAMRVAKLPPVLKKGRNTAKNGGFT